MIVYRMSMIRVNVFWNRMRGVDKGISLCDV